MEVQVLPGAPLRSLRQAAKASVLHTDIPRFESWSEHHHLSRSSKAEHPADNRKTAVRYRAGEPTTGDRHDNHQTNGAACRRASIAGGPGAFKPESVGQRAFNPRARGSTPPGSSNPRCHTRLAQSVERRPLKSEVRGSSPRSCANLFEQDLRRICRGGPAVYGLRRVRFPCRSPVSSTRPPPQPTTKGGLP